MVFQLRTDNHIRNSDDFAASVRADVEAEFGPRFGDRLRRVEVYLEDVNADKAGDADIRCTFEVHLAGKPAVAAEGRAAGVDEAVEGAMSHVLRVLEKKAGKVDDRAGHTSAAGEQGY